MGERVRYSVAQTARICRVCGLSLFSMLVHPDGVIPGVWVCARCGGDGELPVWAAPAVYSQPRKGRVLHPERRRPLVKEQER